MIRDILLEVGAQVRRDFTLEIGQLAEVVEVVAEGTTPVETVNTSISTMVDQRRIIALPLSTRDTSTLVRMQAGVVGDNFNGTRIGSQNVVLDGVNIQDNRFQGGADGGASIFPSMNSGSARIAFAKHACPPIRPAALMCFPRPERAARFTS